MASTRLEVEDAPYGSGNFKRMDEKLRGEIPSNKYIFQQCNTVIYYFELEPKQLLIALASLTKSAVCCVCVCVPGAMRAIRESNRRETEREKTVCTRVDCDDVSRQSTPLCRAHDGNLILNYYGNGWKYYYYSCIENVSERTNWLRFFPSQLSFVVFFSPFVPSFFIRFIRH